MFYKHVVSYRSHHSWECICYYEVTRSKKTESDRDIRKTRKAFKILRFCGKRKDCTRQLISILKH